MSYRVTVSCLCVIASCVAVAVSIGGCSSPTHPKAAPYELVQPWAQPIQSPGSFVTGYVSIPDRNQVIPVDLASGTAIAPIEVGSHPDPIAVSPDGKLVLTGSFPNHRGGHIGSVTAIDTVSRRVITRITLPGDHPSSIAFSPDGRTAWATMWSTGTIVPIGTRTLTPGSPIAVGGHPTGIQITHDGKWALLADFGADVGWIKGAKGRTVDLVDLMTRRVAARAVVGPQPCDIEINATDTEAWVTVSGSDVVVPITLQDFRTHSPLHVGEAPEGIALSPDGSTLYLTEKGVPLMSPELGRGAVVALDLTTGKVRTVIGRLEDPWSVKLTPDGGTAYVTDTDQGSLLVVDLPGGAFRSIPMGSRSHAIVLSQA